jgi:glyoxylase-like metal-dependent hydrolase (beta-lactamase superfamily II)
MLNRTLSIVALVLTCLGAEAHSFAAPCTTLTSAREKPVHVSGNVFVLQASGGNVIFSVGRDGVFIVDARSTNAVQQIVEFAARQGFGPLPLRYIVSTHSHRDHTQGNVAATRQTTILAQTRTAARLHSEQRFQGRLVDAAPSAEWPTQTFEEQTRITFNGETIDIVHVPGAHTDGDAAVLFTGSGVAALGDVFFHEHFPYVDAENGGDLDALELGVESLLSRLPEETRIIGGHFAATSCVSDLRNYRDMIRETRSWADAAARDGRTSESLRSEGVPARFRSWSWGVVPESLWIETLVKGRHEQ